PVFLSVRYVTISLHEAATLLLPKIGHINRQDLAIDFGMIAFWGLVILLIITFFVKLPYRIWFWTHRFLGVFFFFAGLHVLLITSDVSSDNFLRYYLLSFV